MCFDLDSRPPVVPIAGGAIDSRQLVLTASDGNRFRAFEARPATPSGAAMLILPDVRGLHPYYEELALRFAEHGIGALAIDYFGRTAGVDARPATFEYRPHVDQTTWTGLQADIRAGAEALRSLGAEVAGRSFSVGFCFGGRMSYLAATLGLGLAGVIAFYGPPLGTHYTGSPAPAEVADRIRGRVLAIYGGADGAIASADIETFETALTRAGVDHRVITYPDAPHSFFDRKASEYAEASAAAWEETLRFVREGV
ncbi:MAG TPA: dienelactone hydrolase family protein [Candidatus Limnocylindrales bacterium]|nr:dienelactone hydrolase family protein [Candidatus Limnocylindrales bacterium]